MKPFYLVMICLVVFMFGCTPVQTVNRQGRSSTIYKPKRSCVTSHRCPAKSKPPTEGTVIIVNSNQGQFGESPGSGIGVFYLSKEVIVYEQSQ